MQWTSFLIFTCLISLESLETAKWNRLPELLFAWKLWIRRLWGVSKRFLWKESFFQAARPTHQSNAPNASRRRNTAEALSAFPRQYAYFEILGIVNRDCRTLPIIRMRSHGSNSFFSQSQLMRSQTAAVSCLIGFRETGDPPGTYDVNLNQKHTQLEAFPQLPDPIVDVVRVEVVVPQTERGRWAFRSERSNARNTEKDDISRMAPIGKLKIARDQKASQILFSKWQQNSDTHQITRIKSPRQLLSTIKDSLQARHFV